jgi:hypothetical protein
MSQLMWQLASMLMSLVSLPLLSLGTDTAAPLVWVIGLVLVGVAGVIPPMLRYITPGAPQEDGDAEDGDGNGDGDNGGGDIT